jgi:tetratricopeptide (TPR) repeat protein
MALVYRKMGDWKSSQDLIMKVIEEEPHDALTLTNIGLSFFYLHSYDTSIYYHQKATEAMPEWSGPYYNLIESLIMKYGDTDLAGDVLDSAAARTGERMQYHKIIFSVYEGKYEEALKLASVSTDADFGFPGLQFLVESSIYKLLNDERMSCMYNDTALVILKQMVADYPDNPYAYAYCGLAYAGAGRMDEAISSGKMAVELSGMDAMMKSEMEVTLAKIYLLTGKYDEAIALVDQLVINPSSFSLNLTKVDPEWKLLTDVPGYDLLTGERAGIR